MWLDAFTVLLVEDDENKRRQISHYLNEAFPNANVKIARSLQSGLRLIIAGGIDLILLDMTMPTFDITADEDGGRPQPYAGREILRQMDRRGIVTPAIVITQFDRFGEGQDALTLGQLDAQLRADYQITYKGAVQYDVTFEEWKDSLAESILGAIISREL